MKFLTVVVIAAAGLGIAYLSWRDAGERPKGGFYE